MDDPERAAAVLREHHFIVKLTDVVAAVMDDRPGGLTAILSLLADANVSVEYLYAFVGNRDGHAVVVMRTDDPEATLTALAAHHVNVLAPKDVYRL